MAIDERARAPMGVEQHSAAGEPQDVEDVPCVPPASSRRRLNINWEEKLAGGDPTPFPQLMLEGPMYSQGPPEQVPTLPERSTGPPGHPEEETPPLPPEESGDAPPPPHDQDPPLPYHHENEETPQ
eukprot:3999004-Pyramimonas_sp.AAC.1